MKTAAILIAVILIVAAVWQIVRPRHTHPPISDDSVVSGQLGGAPKKEWRGESGYCNCLLVTMARMRLPELLISTERELPDLESLASTRPDTLAWLKAQQIDLKELDKTTIIRTLAETGGISPGGDTSGKLDVRDVEGDSMPMVVREYRLQLGRDGEGMALKISQTLKP